MSGLVINRGQRKRVCSTIRETLPSQACPENCLGAELLPRGSWDSAWVNQASRVQGGWRGAQGSPLPLLPPSQNAPPPGSLGPEHKKKVGGPVSLGPEAGKGAGRRLSSLPADEENRQNKSYNCKSISFSLVASHQGPLREPLI